MAGKFTAIAGNLPSIYANGLNVLRQHGHIKTRIRLSRPNMIYVTINQRCNLRCKYCESWKLTDEGELPTATWIKAFAELLSWTKHPKLNISGGEPFLRKDIFELLDFCVRKGAITGIVTNGYTMTAQMAPRIVSLGLSNINISIDSLNPDIFDSIRAEGYEGHTQRVINSILMVMSEIRKQRVNTKLFLKTVVCGPNADSLPGLVEFVQAQGIAGIMFQPLEAVFGRTVDYGNEWHKHTSLWPDNPEELAQVAEKLIELKQRGAPIMNTIAQLKTWGAYFRDPIDGVRGQQGAYNIDNNNGKTTSPCRIGYTHLYLTANGNVHLCPDYPPIGNVLDGSIKEYWMGDAAEQIRDSIAQCAKPCTKTCLLARGFKDTVDAFIRLAKPNKF